MTQQIINVGTSPNDNTGDPLRTGGQKANANFTELYGWVPVQRSITSGPVTISSTDRILNLNLTSPTSITLPAASSRAGVPLTFKDVGGHAAASNITLNRAGSDTIDGLTSVVLANNFQALTLNPFNDGVNSGWFIT